MEHHANRYFEEPLFPKACNHLPRELEAVEINGVRYSNGVKFHYKVDPTDLDNIFDGSGNISMTLVIETPQAKVRKRVKPSVSFGKKRTQLAGY